ncbi:MAG: hypothetical protein ACLFRG_12440 [Desulfococcaceae bacterium]
MIKVKTFTSPLKIFEAKNELMALDQNVNAFLEKTGVKRVVSVSDACTTDDSGASIGLIRVVTFEV